MNYKIKFTYFDDKELYVTVPKEKLDQFFSSLNASQIFWDENHSQGFWTNIEKVRHMHIFSIPQENEIQQEEVQQ